jgi:alpha-1,3-rhamnosyltransferase
MKPLVSIVVVTYNAAEYIIETLESIKNQTYQYIELIISDDCSTDNTVDVCKKWVEVNRNKFVNAQLVCSEKNTGVAPNCNRGVRSASGEWIKNIAGDDMLLPYSITEFVNFVIENDCKICCCKLHLFGNNKKLINTKETWLNECYKILKEDLTCQRKRNLKELFAPGPGLFYSKELFDSINGFDESYPFFEEWPFASRVLTSGNRIFFVNKYLLQYRIHSNSLSHDELGLNESVFRDVKKYIYQEKLIDLIRYGDILSAWDLHLRYSYLTCMYHSKKDSFVFRFAKCILLFSPLAYVYKLKKIYRIIRKLQ